MSIPRFYLDANSVSAALARALRRHGIDVETANEAGLRTADDDLQVAHVLATGRIMITGDHRLKHQFIQFTRQGGHHPGVLFLPARERKKIGAIVFTLRLTQAVHTAEELVDRVEYIPY